MMSTSIEAASSLGGRAFAWATWASPLLASALVLVGASCRDTTADPAASSGPDAPADARIMGDSGQTISPADVVAAEVTPPVPTGVAESTLAMAKRLEELVAAWNLEEATLLNEARADHLKSVGAPDVIVGWELLAAGRNLEAIEAFERSLADAEANRGGLDASDIHQIKRLLAMGYMRLGEEENCVGHAGHADSCIVPIPQDGQSGGLHSVRRGSMNAAALFEELLAAEPDDHSSIWLLNIARMTLGEYPDGVPEAFRIEPAALTSEYDIGRFTNQAGPLGVAASGLAGGAITDDFDGDGLLDIVASSWGPGHQLRFFRNTSADGKLSFKDDTEAAALTGLSGGLHINQADYDNDGHLDLLMLRGGWRGFHGNLPNSLVRNRGNGTFEDVTLAAGLTAERPTQTAAWTDIDLDGWLDLVIGNEVADAEGRSLAVWMSNGDGTFRDATVDVKATVTGVIKAVTAGDLDNDGFPDLYISRFGRSNVLLHNVDGRYFVDLSQPSGTTAPNRSFPAWIFDYDNDGWLDIGVSAYGFPGSGAEDEGQVVIPGPWWKPGDTKVEVPRGQRKTSDDVGAYYRGRPGDWDTFRLYRNQADGTFEDVGPELGLDAPMWTMGCNYGDLDNDGWQDFYLSTGAPWLTSIVPNLMLRNNAGKGFQDVTTSGGFGHIQKGHSVAFADLDNDGDQDVYTTLGGAYSGDVFQNALWMNPGHGNSWITLQLVGTRSNRSAIGARVRIVVVRPDGSLQTLHRRVSSGASFGGNSLQLAATASSWRWGSGTRRASKRSPCGGRSVAPSPSASSASRPARPTGWSRGPRSRRSWDGRCWCCRTLCPARRTCTTTLPRRATGWRRWEGPEPRSDRDGTRRERLGALPAGPLRGRELAGYRFAQVAGSSELAWAEAGRPRRVDEDGGAPVFEPDPDQLTRRTRPDGCLVVVGADAQAGRELLEEGGAAVRAQRLTELGEELEVLAHQRLGERSHGVEHPEAAFRLGFEQQGRLAADVLGQHVQRLVDQPRRRGVLERHHRAVGLREGLAGRTAATFRSRPRRAGVHGHPVQASGPHDGHRAGRRQLGLRGDILGVQLDRADPSARVADLDPHSRQAAGSNPSSRSVTSRDPVVPAARHVVDVYRSTRRQVEGVPAKEDLGRLQLFDALVQGRVPVGRVELERDRQPTPPGWDGDLEAPHRRCGVHPCGPPQTNLSAHAPRQKRQGALSKRAPQRRDGRGAGTTLARPCGRAGGRG